MDDDDLSSSFLAGRDSDTELDDDLARLKQVDEHEESSGFLDGFAEAHGATEMSEAQNQAAGSKELGKFIMKLPRNVTVGVLDAAVNAFEFAGDVVEEAAGPGGAEKAALDQVGMRKAPPEDAQEAREAALASPMDKHTPALMQAMRGLRGELAANSGKGDELTQSAAQFLIPFAGWAKVLGLSAQASKAVKAGKAVAAEAATLLTAFEPHAARFSDLLRHLDTENRLVNAYIDYFAQDADEGEMEGRWKNVADGLISSAGLAGVVKAGGAGLRGARKMIKKTEKSKSPDKAGA